jgi:hypothetical protein
MSDNDTKPTAEYGADSDVARFFGIHPKSLRRWDARPELNFPAPIRVNGRKYRRWTEVHEFARRAAAMHASKTA